MTAKEMIQMRDENNFLTKETFQDIKRMPAAVEAKYPGVKVVAVDEIEDVQIFGHEYIESMAASIEEEE
jgi:hypothetical protein